MDKLRSFFEKLFKGKNINSKLVVIGVIGVVLLVVSGRLLDPPEIIPRYIPQLPQVETTRQEDTTYERLLEQRLEEAFRSVSGVGEVSVMLTLRYGAELTVAQDVSQSDSHTVEEDASGGTREVTNNQVDTRTVLLGGNATPLVLKETMPQVEGVIIVAQGGGNIRVVEALVNATRAVLGIDAHRITVLEKI